MTHKITILHTLDCAGATEARRIADRLAASRDDVAVDSVLIESDAEAQLRGFRGSPTVLVDGADVEAEPASPVGTMG